MSAQRVPYTRDESVAGWFDQIIDRTVDALAEEGFGVMWEVDAQATSEEKLGNGFRNYVILGACARDLAGEALGHEARLGALLPCTWSSRSPVPTGSKSAPSLQTPYWVSSATRPSTLSSSRTGSVSIWPSAGSSRAEQAPASVPLGPGVSAVFAIEGANSTARNSGDG